MPSAHESAEWTADELIEAMKRCPRTDAPIYFHFTNFKGPDLYLLDVATANGEIRLTFQEVPEDEGADA